jgi:hypothetical protein
MENTPRMRSLRQLAAEYKVIDPKTRITLHLLRQLVAQGKLPIVYAGRIPLLNADITDAYFADGQLAQKR